MAHKPLTILNLLSDEGKGGADRLALDIAKGLKQQGHRVIWGCPGNSCLIDEAVNAGLEIYNLYPSGSRDLKALPDLIKFCRQGHVNIVNAHHSHGRLILVMARLLGLKAKVVFTRHCIKKELPYIGSFFYNFIADMNIAVSNTVRESLLKSGIWSGRAVTVYGGIEQDKFKDIPAKTIYQLREKYACRGAFNVGIVARFHTGRNFHPGQPTMKGHEFLFRALAGLNINFKVIVLGVWVEGDIENLKLVAGHNGLAADKLICCGFQKDIAPFYKMMDLVVLPSSNEGLGLTLIEAMAAGVPCIGTDDGGIREIITNGVNGFLFKKGNSSDLADKIKILSENKILRDKFILNGKKKVEKMFTIANTLSETEAIFYGLLK